MAALYGDGKRFCSPVSHAHLASLERLSYGSILSMHFVVDSHQSTNSVFERSGAVCNCNIPKAILVSDVHNNASWTFISSQQHLSQ